MLLIYKKQKPPHFWEGLKYTTLCGELIELFYWRPWEGWKVLRKAQKLYKVEIQEEPRRGIVLYYNTVIELNISS